MRYYLVDRIEEFKKFEYAKGVKCISLSDDVFEHHFPGQPVFPGALLIETMAQLGGALIELSFMKDNSPIPRAVLSSVKSKFRDFAKPGDKISFTAKINSLHEDSALLNVVGSIDDKKICESQIIFVFLNIDDPLLETSRRQFLQQLTRHTKVVE